MSRSDLQIVAALLAVGADANKKCDFDAAGAITWAAGGSDSADATSGTINCGTVHGANILPFAAGQSTRDTGADDAGFGTAGAERGKCCQAACAITTWKSGADPGSLTVAPSATVKGTAYCGTDKLPLATSTQATTVAHATSDYTTLSYPTSTNADLCCQDACKTTNTEYKAGAGTNSGTSYYCGTDKVPNINQATLLSGAYSNAGSQTTACCSDACGKVSFMAGVGTDDSAATKPKYFCGLNRGPVAGQTSKPSGSNSVGANEKNTCCDDYCGKVTFSAGAGKDDAATVGSETYFCGADRVPVADQETTLAGTDSIGAGEKNTCCDDACGKVTYKSGKGKDDSKSKTFFCGENKVPKKKQGDIPSGSDSIGSGQKGTCCAAACSTAKYTAGNGNDKDTKYYCGEGKMPLPEQKTLPCDGSKCTSSGKTNCCTATCSADDNKWAAGAKPKTPATKTMYCGKGMVPKAGLSSVACTADPCDEATDASLCCEKPKKNNSTGTTTGAANAGLAAFVGVLVMGAAIFV